MDTVQYRLTGLSPLLLHSGQAIDPLNHYAKELKRVSKKRSKTDDDQLVMSHLEWYMSLYHNGPQDQIEDGQVTVDPSARIILPSYTIEAMLVAGAKKKKMGPAAKAGIIVDSDAILEYDGPNDINKLWAGGKHIHRVAVRVSAARIMRTRPIFREWAAVIAVMFDNAVLDEPDIYTMLTDAGQQVGIGDWRPRFGRFEVERA